MNLFSHGNDYRAKKTRPETIWVLWATPEPCRSKCISRIPPAKNKEKEVRTGFGASAESARRERLGVGISGEIGTSEIVY